MEEYEDYDDDFEGDEIIAEGAEYSPKSEFNKPKIVDDAVRKCIEARGKEMKEGFWNVLISKNGDPIRTWIADTRLVYIGTVISLKLILTPEIIRSRNKYKDNKLVKTGVKEKIDEFEKEIERVFEKYCYRERKRVNISKVNEEPNFKWLLVKDGNSYIPQIDEDILTEDFVKKKTLPIKGAWNSKVNSYWWDMIKIYDKIFAELNCLVNDLNYFKQGISF